MNDKQINELADKITFNELYKLIRKTVQNGWVEFTETYTNELGDFDNYKDVFLESVEEELDETDEPIISGYPKGNDADFGTSME
tara:strand:- start:69 stop:320 length:252 start_codon:yes stop_codon:yes gene_type:complete